MATRAIDPRNVDDRAGWQQSGDRVTVLGDLHLLARGNPVENSQNVRLQLGGGHLNCHTDT